MRGSNCAWFQLPNSRKTQLSVMSNSRKFAVLTSIFSEGSCKAFLSTIQPRASKRSAGRSIRGSRSESTSRFETGLKAHCSHNTSGGNAMSTKSNVLMTLGVLLLLVPITPMVAQATESPSSEAEKYVLKQVAAGEVADLEGQFKSDEERVIRASFLAALMMNQQGSITIHRMGIRITGGQIRGDLNLANSEIQSFINLKKCHFDDVFFFHTVFNEGLTIDGAIFAGKAEFEYATVMEGLSAQNAKFLNEKEDFDMMKVKGPAFFDNASFAGPVSFGNAVIEGSFTIRGAVFEKMADLMKLKAADAVDGSNAIFKDVADFQCMSLGHNLILGSAIFSGPADFSLANVAGNVELNKATFQNDVQFKDMKAGAVLIDGTQFSKAPNLTNLTYQNIYPTSGLLKLLKNSPSDYSAYTELEKCLQRNGDSFQADEVFIEMKRYERGKNVTQFGYLQFDYLKSWTSEALQGFGRRPQRVVYYDLGIIIFGTLLFRLRKMALKDDVKVRAESQTERKPSDSVPNPARYFETWLSSLKPTQKPRDNDLPRYNSFLYSLTLFAPTIDTNYTNNWEPATKHKLIKHYMRVQRALGYLLVPLTIAIWSGAFR